MALLADFFQIGLILTCLIGLGLGSQRLAPKIPFPLHFCLAPLYLLAALFFVEHFLALGKPQWLWIPMTYGSLWLIYQNTFKKTLSQPVISYFLIGFFCCLFWRFFYPDLIPQSDTIRDLSFVICAAQGTGEPMDDLWITGSKLDTYYVFQFYGGAWIHRAFGCSYGLTYQIAYCVIVGFCTAAIGAGVEVFTRSKLISTLSTIFFCIGGNGATIFAPLMDNFCPGYMAPVCFIGGYAIPPKPTDLQYLNSFGLWLANFIGLSDQVQAPMAYSGFCLFIGDFHPPLIGFLLLSYTMMALFFSERTELGTQVDRVCTFVIVSAPFFLVLSNPWTAPMQGIFLFSWLGYRWLMKRGISFKELFLQFSGAFFLIAPPFLAYTFSHHKSVGFGLDTICPPFLNWLLVMLPAVVCGLLTLFLALREVLNLVVREKDLRSNLSPTAATAGLIVFVGAVTAALTGFARVADSAEHFELYNTTLKTWPWVYQWFVVGGLACLAQQKRLYCIALIPLFLSLVGHVYIFGCHVRDTPPTHPGKLEGYAWLAEDPFQSTILEILKTYPQGVVMESDPELGTPALVFTTFSGNYTLSGAPWQDLEKRKDRDDIALTADKIKLFYHNQLPNPDEWIMGVVPGGVNYIVWQNRDNLNTTDAIPNVWTLLNDQIKQDYDWHPLNSGPNFDPTAPHANPIGIWIRKTAAPHLH